MPGIEGGLRIIREKAATLIAAHSAEISGIHGVGISTVAAVADVITRVMSHQGYTTGVHGVGASHVESIAGSQTKVDTHNTGATHVLDQPALDHGNAKHTPNFLPDNARIPLSCTPAGAAGLVLTGNGAAADPSYQAGAGGIPSGTIVMWHGTIANIPAGYVICDGNNGTPNLLGRMVRQVATAATNPGATGGSNTHRHDTHPVQGGHTHESHTSWEVAGGSPIPVHVAPITHSNEGGHDHGLHSLESNLPLYYDIAFIMKT